VKRKAKAVGRRIATAVPPIADMRGTDLISLAAAVALIASRVRKTGDTDRSARDRARKRLRDHVENKLLAETAPGSCQFTLYELGRWLQGRWPGEFDDVPAHRVVRVPSIEPPEPVGNVTVVRWTTLPNDLHGCHRLIEQLTAGDRDLQRQLETANAEIRDLKPGALKRRELGRKRRDYGRSGGRGKTK
jgi:hypothetical protein